MATGRNHSAHRADYALEFGVWRATCRGCGYTVSDPVRRRAATKYRAHIRAMYAAARTVRVDSAEEPPEPSAL